MELFPPRDNPHLIRWIPEMFLIFAMDELHITWFISSARPEHVTLHFTDCCK